MYPASFAYVAPSTVAEAVRVLAAHGPDAKVLAGGCSLIPLLKLRLAEPRVLIDVRHALSGELDERQGEVRIGAMVRESALERSAVVRRALPILVDTCEVIADPIVRNMATVGGNVAHADPANDHPATMLALGVTFGVQGPAGERLIAVDDFFLDLYATALAADEILTEIRVPLPSAGSGGAYEKLERQVGDFAIVAAAVQVRIDEGRFVGARIALTNMAPTAVRAREAEALLLGSRVDDATLDRVAAASVVGLEPWDELRGSASYKLDVLPVIVRRALRRAVDRAAAGAAGAQGAR